MSKNKASPKWLIFVTTSILLLLMNIDMTAVNLAMAPIAADLRLSIIDAQWVVSAYLIGGASLVMLGGLLGDVYGHRKIFIIGAAIFTVASLGVGLSVEEWSLAITRLCQGFGAALAWPLAIVIVREAFGEQKGLAMGLITAVMALSMSIGPPVGGLILSYLDWRWIFLINLPIGFFVILMAWWWLPQDEHLKTSEKLHLKSVFLLTFGLLLLTYAINEGQVLGFGSMIILPALLLGIGFLSLFVWWQRRLSNPLIDLKLFKDSALTSCLGIRFIWQVVWVGLFLILSLFLQNILGDSALYASVYFLSLTVSYAIVAPFGGRLMARFSSRGLILSGALLSLVPLAWLSFPFAQTNTVMLLAILSLYGISTAIVFPTLLNTTLALAPKKRRGMVSGILYMMMFAGGSTGAIAVGALINSVTSHQLARLTAERGLVLTTQQHTILSNFASGVRDICQLPDIFSGKQLQIFIDLIKQSFSHAMTIIMLCAFLISLVMVFAAKFANNPDDRSSKSPSQN